MYREEEGKTPLSPWLFFQTVAECKPDELSGKAQTHHILTTA